MGDATMKKSMVVASAAFGAALLATSTAFAGPERVAYPAGFETKFARYAVIDRKGKPTARFMYVDRPSLAAAKAGEPLPDGAVLVMEDHAIRVEGDAPVLDAAGRYIPTDAVTNVFVMQKGAGWGDAYPADVRNGDWEYAWFMADGARRADKTMENCFACHKKQTDADYTFSFQPFLESR